MKPLQSITNRCFMFALLLACGAVVQAQQSAVLAARTSPQSTPTTLATGGKAQMPIVIAADASPNIKSLAQELAEYLKRISGAEFLVQTGDGKTGIVLGTTAQFPHPEFNSALARRGQFDGEEAFVIRSRASGVLLLGATELGASHAVFRLLETLGCRWYFPSRAWEVVPSRPTLQINIDEADRPAVLSRRIWYGFGIFTDKGQPQSRAVVDYNAWSRHNRMAQSFDVNNGHAWGNIITQYRDEFAAHPEYLALVRQKDGTLQRQTFDLPMHVLKLNPGEPGVQRLVEKYVVEYFRKQPHRDMVSIEPSDGGGHCECDKCLALGSISNRVFGLANIAARAVQKEFPGKMVGLYAYNDQSVPPTFELEPNVYVELTAGFNRGEFTFDELKGLWAKKCKNLGYYLYLSVWSPVAQDAPQKQGGANIKQLQTSIRDYASRGAASITAESSNNWGLNGRGYYIANRLMWNPNADVTALLDDFYRNAFGKAAAPMQRYWERFDPGNDPIVGQHLIALGLRDLEEASRLASGDDAVQTRLDELKQHLHYVRLYWEYSQLNAKDKPVRKQATLEVLNWSYRTRYAYMQHYMAMLQSWARGASKEFDEPDWHIAVRKDKPWETGAPPTREETERLFLDDSKYFPLQPVEEKTFSADMVPVVFSGDRPEFSKPAKSSELYQGGPRYLLYSVAGEAIEIDIFPGFIPAYRDRAPSRYVLLDASGKEINSGRLPLDNEKHALKFAVPKAGLYYFDFTDGATGWRLEAEPGKVATIQLEPSRRIASLGNLKTMYFYVPRGTKSVDFFFKGYKHNMNGPDGKLVFAVPSSSGANFSVPVPAGQDGKLWNLSALALGYFGFYNIPNFIAASPAALLVPREVAEKDGLPMRR